MKKYIKVIAFALCAGLGFLLSSCYEPSPLYGKWEANDGSFIQFVSGGDEFNAKIYYTTDKGESKPKLYTGTYSYIENTVTLDYRNTDDEAAKNGDRGTMNSEWDVRGSILYLTWTSILNGTAPETITLTLYHTSK